MGPCSMSMIITFTVRVIKQHPVNIIVKLSQKTGAAHYIGIICIVVLESK